MDRKIVPLKPAQRKDPQKFKACRDEKVANIWSSLAELRDDLNLVSFAMDGLAFGGSEVTEEELRPIQIRMTDILVGLRRIVTLAEGGA